MDVLTRKKPPRRFARTAGAIEGFSGIPNSSLLQDDKFVIENRRLNVNGDEDFAAHANCGIPLQVLASPVRELGLEGMVAKRRRSEYAGALTHDWLKVKCLRVHDFVIGGWIPSSDRRISALLMGEFIGGNLRYVGQVGSPLDSHVMRAVGRMLTPRATSPFADAVENADFKFCEPVLRAAVEFMGFTDDGYLRCPAFLRFADEVISRT